MTYALIINGAVAQHPYSFAQLRRDHPDVSFPSAPSDEVLARFGVFKVHPSARPAHDPDTQNVTEAAPTLVNGQWVQGWVIEPATAEQIAARQLSAELEAEHSAAQLDAWVRAYLAMTPEGAEQYVLNNTATLAAMRSVVSKLAYSVRVLIRRGFNR